MTKYWRESNIGMGGLGAHQADLFAPGHIKRPSQSHIAWNEERTAECVKLWKEGLSANQIANRLGGVSRNAVIGKIHRLGLSGRANPPRPKSVRARRERKAANDKPPKFKTTGNAAFRALFNGGANEPYTPPVEELVIPLAERRYIATLEAGECRWGIGDPKHADFHFCGKRQHPGLPYCTHHARIAFQPPQAKGTRPNLNAQTVGLGLIDRVNEFFEKERT